MSNEFLNRVKLLMEYDTSRTLTENKKVIIEQEKFIARTFGTLGKDAAEEVFQKAAKTGGLFDTAGKRLSSADDLSKALKAGTISAQTMGKVRQGLLKSSGLSATQKTSLIDDMVANPNVTSKYKAMSKEEIFTRFKNQGYGDDVAEEISTKLTRKRAGLSTSPKTTTATGTTSKVTTPKVTKTVSGKTKNLKPKRKKTINPKTEEQLLETAAKNPGWKWRQWLKWGAGIGIGGGLIWWWFFSSGKPAPDDMPDTQPNDGGNTTTTATIPSELKDVEGVKKFQDWADANHAGWATGYPEGKLNKAGGYGRFGPRTSAAWTKYKDEYMKGVTPTPSPTQTTPTQVTPTVTPVVDDNQLTDVDNY